MLFSPAAEVSQVDSSEAEESKIGDGLIGLCITLYNALFHAFILHYSKIQNKVEINPSLSRSVQTFNCYCKLSPEPESGIQEQSNSEDHE